MPRIISQRVRIISLFFLLAALLPASTSAAKFPHGWIEVRSEHFILVTDMRPKAAKGVVTHFEQIRSLVTQALPLFSNVSEPPLRVFAARNQASFEILAPAYAKRAGNVRTRGLFRRSPGEKVIILSSFAREGNYGTVYHEFFHYLASHANLQLPPWLGEGLADYWGGGAKLTDDAATAGQPLKRRLPFLERGRRLIPMDEFFSADRGSRYYSPEGQAGLFYAQSWALVHMMLSGEETAQDRPKLSQYIRAVQGGVDSLEAARQSFGDLDKLKKRLRSYVRQFSLRAIKLPLPAKPDPESFQLEQLSRGEAAAMIARYTGGRPSIEDSRARVSLALSEAEDLAESHEARGLLALRESEFAAAETAFTAATRLESGPLAHYGAVVTGFHLARQAGDLSEQRLQAFEGSLLAAISADDKFAPAFARLATIYHHLDKAASDRALTAIRQAVELEPHYYVYRLKWAQLLLEAGRRDEAHLVVDEEVQRALQIESSRRSNGVCWKGAIWGLAERVLPACDQAVALAPESGSIRDSRAVAYLLAGDLEKGAEDLRTTLELVPADWDSRDSRSAWLTAVAAKRNPLIGPEAVDLASDWNEEGIGWLH